MNIKRLKLYNLNEIAEVTGASLSTLRNAIKQGKLKARKIGREYKCTMMDLLKFLNISEQDFREVA